jgi:hypothetical protein
MMRALAMGSLHSQMQQGAASLTCLSTVATDDGDKVLPRFYTGLSASQTGLPGCPGNGESA